MIRYSLENHDEINIATPEGGVILLPQKDYEEMLETLRLLADKKSLRALLESHKARDEHKKLENYSIEDVFGDLQN